MGKGGGFIKFKGEQSLTERGDTETAQGGKGPIIANEEVVSEISFRNTILINCLNCGKWMKWLPMDSEERSH